MITPSNLTITKSVFRELACLALAIGLCVEIFGLQMAGAHILQEQKFDQARSFAVPFERLKEMLKYLPPKTVGAMGANKKPEDLLNTYNKSSARNGTPDLPQFTIRWPMRITHMQTYHWNNGKGTPQPGQIGIAGKGFWQASGHFGGSNTPNAEWIVTPNLVLQPGTYFVMDSDLQTWSTNGAAKGIGFAIVRGVPVGSANQAIPASPAEQNVANNTPSGSTRPTPTQKPKVVGLDKMPVLGERTFDQAKRFASPFNRLKEMLKRKPRRLNEVNTTNNTGQVKKLSGITTPSDQSQTVPARNPNVAGASKARLTISPEDSVSPATPVTVEWTAPSNLHARSIIALVNPTEPRAGNPPRYYNSKRMDGQSTGVWKLKAPNKVGPYEFRIYDPWQRKTIASTTFSVEAKQPVAAIDNADGLIKTPVKLATKGNGFTAPQTANGGKSSVSVDGGTDETKLPEVEKPEKEEPKDLIKFLQASHPELFKEKLPGRLGRRLGEAIIDAANSSGKSVAEITRIVQNAAKGSVGDLDKVLADAENNPGLAWLIPVLKKLKTAYDRSPQVKEARGFQKYLESYHDDKILQAQNRINKIRNQANVFFQCAQEKFAGYESDEQYMRKMAADFITQTAVEESKRNAQGKPEKARFWKRQREDTKRMLADLSFLKINYYRPRSGQGCNILCTRKAREKLLKRARKTVAMLADGTLSRVNCYQMQPFAGPDGTLNDAQKDIDFYTKRRNKRTKIIQSLGLAAAPFPELPELIPVPKLPEQLKRKNF